MQRTKKVGCLVRLGLCAAILACFVLSGGCHMFVKNGAPHDEEVVAKYARLERAVKKADKMSWHVSVEDVADILDVPDLSAKWRPGTWDYTYTLDTGKNSRKIVLDFYDNLLIHALLFEPAKPPKK